MRGLPNVGMALLAPQMFRLENAAKFMPYKDFR